MITFAEMVMNETTRQYVRAHRTEDVRRLALATGKRTDGVDMTQALQQIAGWQTARRKLPSWSAVDDIIYPPHLNMEQCSGEQTARYKASLLMEGDGERASLVDLTGGLGVDFSWMARPFRRRVYVERSDELCAVARHNFPLLGITAEVVCDDAEHYVQTMEPVSVIYLDPARRDEHGGRTYGIRDCTPDVLSLLPLLRAKAARVVVKLSPMLDWRKAVSDLQVEGGDGLLADVHIVSVDNECKELLLVMDREERKPPRTPRLVCVNNGSVFVTTHAQGTTHASCDRRMLEETEWLFEPNASIMKAGCFGAVAEAYGVTPMAVNSHLMVARHDVPDFPGRRFQMLAVTSLNKQEVRKTLADIGRANIAVRNFPLTAEQLRKRLRLKDGGDRYLFGTTLADDSRLLLLCRKIG